MEKAILNNEIEGCEDSHPFIFTKEGPMNIDRNILRICATAILCAVFLRLLGNVSLGSALGPEDVASMALFLQTGRVVRQGDIQETTPETEPTVLETAPPEKQPLSFSPEDAQAVEIYDYAGKDPDLEALLMEPLSWDLTQEQPTVLILHTHASESYENTEGYTESSQYRTLEEGYNMISIGDAVAEALTQQGITVLHDRTLHDYPSYDGSYDNARQTISQYLSAYPSIRLVLDLHRDAMVDSSGQQIGYTVSTEKGEAAKVMLVVGCNNDAWAENMALAVKMQVRLEALCPGICRPICLRNAKFNQDQSPGALLIEMGAAGNTRQEALLAAEYVAQAIVELAVGTS